MTMKAPSGVCLFLLLATFIPAAAQSWQAAEWPPARLLPIDLERSAELAWLNKPVLERRLLDDMGDAGRWTFSGTGTLSLPADTTPDGRPVLRVDLTMFPDEPAPTRNGLSAVNLRRPFPGEDWRGYNRIALWIRPAVSGFPMLPLQIVLHNEGEERVPDVYYREGIHYVTLRDGVWQRVVWEIEPLARDRVTAIEIGYWVNKMLAAPGDRVAFEIGGLELQRVAPDHYAGWSVAPGRIAYSHAGYLPASPKTALAGDLEADRFELVRLDGAAQPEVVLVAPVRRVRTRFGEFQLLDFSAVTTPGRYMLRAGDRTTEPFRIDHDAWRDATWAALNFMFGERCGHVVPGSHGVCHADWTATHGEERVVMNGGWHDAGDLSQGAVNTGEATYTLFALAERLRAQGGADALVDALLDEAKWGLDWLLRVRFDGGYRVGFAGNNLWTNGILGDADDRSAEARNDANVNYIAAAAGAIAYRVLKEEDPTLAERSLRMAEADWRHAAAGEHGPETWTTPAFAATAMELASIGVLASLELHAATGRAAYAEKAVELGRVIVASQQADYVGTEFPLAGFFHADPTHEAPFHQFHRGNDQAPIVALARLVEALPENEEWMRWYGAVVRYAEYQKATAGTTAPYGVLPAYVYHEDDWFAFPEQAARHQASRDAFRAQVLEGMPMGDGYHLRAFPVWFARRGNYGVLLSQAKALSTAALLRRDTAAAELAQRQAQWVLGRNPFVQSTMYGVGHDWAQQYSVSSGDLVGALPVGMQSHGIRDVPYWPSQNTYVYKEVWIHSVSRWLWLMADLAGSAVVEGRVAPGAARVVELTDAAGATRVVESDRAGVFRARLPAGRYTARSDGRSATLTALPGGTHGVDLRPGRVLELGIEAVADGDGAVGITVRATGEGTHRLRLRAENLEVDGAEREVTLRAGAAVTVRWNARIRSLSTPWVAVVVPDGEIARRVEVTGHSRTP